MGLDGTIKRADGGPLGSIPEVEKALAAAFPGVKLGWLASGEEKIRIAAERGVVFPEVIRQHFESMPSKFGGHYEGPQFSAQFDLGASEVVKQIDVVLYGNTESSTPIFERLELEFGWRTTHP